MKQRIAAWLTVAALIAGCDDAKQPTVVNMKTYPADPHSFARPNEVAMKHLELSLRVDFDSKVLTGYATYHLERQSGSSFVLDVRGQNIMGVYGNDDQELSFRVARGNALGDALEIELLSGTETVTVYYTTSPGAEALFWTEPSQTIDGAPLLFTQGQAVLTRTWIPIQDSPAIRFTYNAQVKVPEGMIALMSAVNPISVEWDGDYRFQMSRPIPPYLMALAVGNLEFRAIGARTGVYAEPGLVEAAAWEFADMERMLEVAEGLYGPYQWGRYDLLILPTSFPFGGMENPMLTFATPTIIAGDRSLVSLVAHELAHSWSGNLVTNATWDDFWLNEGFTVYFENRIMESLFGKPYAEMLSVLGYQDLLGTIDEMGSTHPDTHLKLSLAGRDPDDGMTDIAYEKGFLFLYWLEHLVGREPWDVFLKQYFTAHQFQTMTTEAFVAYLDSHLLGSLPQRPDVEAWIYGSGLPEGHPVLSSELFDNVDAVRNLWLGGKINTHTQLKSQASDWSTHEWLHFIRGLGGSADLRQLAELDRIFSLTQSANTEIAAAWLTLSVQVGYKEAYPALESFLLKVGRRKFIKPLYTELARTAEGKQWATEVYARARSNYHAVSVQTIDAILGYKEG